MRKNPIRQASSDHYFSTGRGSLVTARTTPAPWLPAEVGAPPWTFDFLATECVDSRLRARDVLGEVAFDAPIGNLSRGGGISAIFLLTRIALAEFF